MNRNKLFINILLCLIAFNAVLMAQKQRVSLIINDSNLKVTNEVINQIYNDSSKIKEKVEFKIYSTGDIKKDDIEFLRKSDVIFVWAHGFTPILKKLKTEFEDIIKNKGRIYVFGASSSEKEYKKMGLTFDKQIAEYASEGGSENIKNMIMYSLKKDLTLSVNYKPVLKHAQDGLYDFHTKKMFADYQSFIKGTSEYYKKENPTIGFFIRRNTVITGQTNHVNSLLSSIEKYGFNLLPAFGFYADSTMSKYFLDKNGKSRVNLVITFSLWHGVNPDDTRKVFEKLGVPIINSIQLMGNKENWETSIKGIDIFQRTLLIGIPELMGTIQPTVMSSKEKIPLKQNGKSYYDQQPLPDRIKRLTDRVKAWYYLQTKPNNKKKFAIIYYSYPPGKQGIGASYLNVLPQSLFEITNRLKAEGYHLGNSKLEADSIYKDVISHGRNIGNWAEGEVDKLVSTGKSILIPFKEYKKWFKQLSQNFQKQVIEAWGNIEDANVMKWTDKDDNSYIVIPAVKYGNILLTPQPVRGSSKEDIDKAYHDLTRPPDHQYIAFYLFLKKSFQADALMHLGTHGTHEWLKGKEAGFSDNDSPEALIRDMPNIYAFIVDDVGEGLQVKRRGMGVVIDHMTPPFDKAEMNPEIRELSDLINEHNVAHNKSPLLEMAKHKEINKLAIKMGILKDIGIDSITVHEEIHKLEHYIKEISEKNTPFGLHTFGRLPDSVYIEKTAEAMASFEKELNKSKRKKLLEEYIRRIKASPKEELNSLINALNGKYILTGKGGDPLRNPNSLPTGRNFYAFDPYKIPSKAVYKLGSTMAQDLIKNYKKKHGVYPDKFTFNLWSTECIRHEGIMEAQILYLMGIKPRWSRGGMVIGLDVIPRKILNRPRIDVVVVPSGLYRDIFGNLMNLIDRAVTLAKEQKEDDNFLRNHIMAIKKSLVEKGVEEKLAEKLASVRMFTVASGSYGTGVNSAIQASGKWEKEEEVASVYFRRMSFMYGQGFWGEKAEATDTSLQKIDFSTLKLFKQNLSGTKAVIHSRSSNVYGVLDNDDFFQYLGSTAMAVRAVDGKTPEVYITNITNPSKPVQETLDKFMGREMRSRYLNPKWINKMMDEGYSGAGFVNAVVANLWGWQVTVPEAVDATKWNQIYETYVQDKFNLNMKERFIKADNLWAYQSMTARMIEVIRKDYWKPEKKIKEKLLSEFISTVEKVGLACNQNVCDNEKLKNFIADEMEKIPSLKEKVEEYESKLEEIRESKNPPEVVPVPESQIAQSSQSGNAKYLPNKNVEGYEMTETSNSEEENQVAERSTVWLFILVIVFLLGWFLWKRKK